MTRVERIRLREILDSRGDRTVEADVLTGDGGFGRAAAPSGASTGVHEAVERDAAAAVAAARDRAVPRLEGAFVGDQRAIDQAIHAADGTTDFSELGANAAVALSMAAATAAADTLGIPLYQHLGGCFRGDAFPVPLGNVLGGGEHATAGPAIQEFLAVPHGAPSVREAAFANAAVHAAVGDALADAGHAAGQGDEGAWAPAVDDTTALETVATAVDAVADDVGFDIGIGLDVAASELWNADAGQYEYDDTVRGPDEQRAYIADLVDRHDLVYVEDPLHEDDFDGFAALTDRLSGDGGPPHPTGSAPLVCGDDLYVTNVDRIERGIDAGAGNAVLIKPNQIGTLSDAMDAIETTVRHGFAPVISHRSGETGDTTIAHLAVATAAPFIKTGAVGGERTAKLNELIRIEDEAL